MVGLSKHARALASAALLISITAPAVSQELVYTPINPSFGGDSFNSAHLLGIANAQNDYKDKEKSSASSSQMDQFVRQLQSRLLSSLAAQVNDAIFGENPQESGTITFGDQVITFVRGVDSVQLTIEDLAAGTTTEIIIPLLGASTDTATASSLNALLPYMSGGSGSLGASGTNLGADDPLMSPAPLSEIGDNDGLGDVTLGGM